MKTKVDQFGVLQVLMRTSGVHSARRTIMNRLIIAILALLAVPALATGREPFRAQGNEPSWSIRMNDGVIMFKPMDGDAVRVTPIPTPRQEGNAEIYEAKVGDVSFTLTIMDKICSDAMSDMPFPQSVALAFGDTTFSGCGGEPATLLHGQWLIIEIDGKPTITGSSPTVNFESDGKISGNATCNRFFGGYTLSGEGLMASDLGASMMMCEQELMDQEMNILQILKELAGFGIGDDDKLILLTDRGRSIIAIPAT